MSLKVWFWCMTVCSAFGIFAACTTSDRDERLVSQHTDLKIDPATGVPYAFTFQFPISGFDVTDFSFGFGGENDHFCLDYSGGECISYGYHLGRDTNVKKTPVGTEVVAPADGIVRLTTDSTYGGYGSDSKANPAYKGCLVLLEHEFPNGQSVTSLLGHVMCESVVTYDSVKRTGNPSVGALIPRGQYVAHVNHYWSGPTQQTDWHHLHWGMRKGAFNASSVGSFVRGYATKSEFTIDPATGVWTHPEWLDPFVIVAANGDPAHVADGDVRQHPSGSLLEDGAHNFWLVVNDHELSAVSASVLNEDRYDASRAIHVSDAELGCYAFTLPQVALGPVLLYKRPNVSTVVMAYSANKSRYDVIRWEALLSWGFSSADLIKDQKLINQLESSYAPKGFRMLRPGTLIKADEESEVAMVTVQQTRLPIASAEVFEALGFSWEQVVSIPKAVLDDVAGPREDVLLDWQTIHACAMPPSCPPDQTCGGGKPPEPDAGSPKTEECNGLDDNDNGQIDEIFQCKLGMKGGGCITACNTAGVFVCTAPTCSWALCQPYPEDCSNTIDDDCNGLTDCIDPACLGTLVCSPSGPDAGSMPDAGALPDASQEVQVPLHFMYTGPVLPGVIQLFAWWQPPQAQPRVWDVVSECVDGVPNDGMLDCIFSVPQGTSPLEFQIALPNGGFWGDMSCTPLGGCGSTVGIVIVQGPQGPFVIDMVPNNNKGQPYFNGKIKNIF